MSLKIKINQAYSDKITSPTRIGGSPLIMADEDDPFIKVTNTRKRKAINNSNDSAISKIKLSNKFTPLANSQTDKTETMDTSAIKNTQKPPKVNPKRIPPIVIHNINFDHTKITNSLKKKCSKEVFIKYLGQNNLQLFANCEEDYNLLLEHFKKHNHTLYTHTPSWNTNKKIVLKGLPQLNDEDIISDLESQGIECIAIYVIKKKTAEMPPNPVRLLKLASNTKLSEVFKIKHVFHTKVKWEHYINKKGVSQCHRCQRFGHGAINCNMPPKCVKCGQDHITAECTKTAETKPVCANCNGDHPASYSQCEKVLEYKNRLQTRSANANLKSSKQKTQFPPLPIERNQQRSWASVANDKHEDTDDIDKIQRLFRGIEKLKSLCNLDDILNKIEKLNKQLEDCETEDEKFIAIINGGK